MNDLNNSSKFGNAPKQTTNGDIPMIDRSETYDRGDDVVPSVPSTVKNADRLEELSGSQRRNDTSNSLLVRRHSESTNNEFEMEMEERGGSIIENETTKREGQRVACLKLLVIVILVSSAFIIAVIVYLYITNSEEKQFIANFQNDAHKVLESIGSSFDRTLGTMNAISVIIVSNAHDQKHPWPLVSLPDFALHASKLIPLTNGLFLSVLPIVYPSQKQQWEEYALQNDYWVNESLALQEIWDGYHGNITYDWARSDSIYDSFGAIDDNVSRFMLPQWQIFPVALEDGYNVYNWDWNSELNPTSVQTCIVKQQTVLSESYLISSQEEDPEANAEMVEWARFYSAYLPPDENSFEPMLDVNYPIIDDVSPAAVLRNGHSTNQSHRPTVGIVAMSIYWRELFKNILTEGSHGIIIVVRNPCNEPFTYQIDGPYVTYQGVGDRHAKNYDTHETMSRLVDLKSFALRDSAYSGAPIDVDFCPYTLHVYPSDAMKADYVSQDAAFFLVAVLLIFLFTSCVFFAYDRYVEKRQYRTKAVALRSSAIVSSLFPSAVREQLYKSTKSQSLRSSEGHTSGGIPTNGADDSIAGTGFTYPIAQVYPHTTVLFADIVGFTNWCSSREPLQVFHLLETLYAGFDALAKTHGVFKIETIGDSYVAVVGLPQPRKRHAVVMAKFADDIRTKMEEMVTQLEDVLGPGTSSLALRIGLNSGSTTAGVLRGEKARFQLFGDTVNTASRMETNSAPNKIHVSASTADLIIAADKGHWLQLRDEEIDVKGKGSMQTYWCNPSTNNVVPFNDGVVSIHGDNSEMSTHGPE